VEREAYQLAGELHEAGDGGDEDEEPPEGGAVEHLVRHSVEIVRDRVHKLASNHFHDDHGGEDNGKRQEKRREERRRCTYLVDQQESEVEEQREPEAGEGHPRPGIGQECAANEHAHHEGRVDGGAEDPQAVVLPLAAGTVSPDVVGARVDVVGNEEDHQGIH
jgi:hypothetical protein